MKPRVAVLLILTCATACGGDGVTARGLQERARRLIEQEDYDSARPLLEQAFLISEDQLAVEHRMAEAATLTILGERLVEGGDCVGARPVLESALDIWRATFGPDSIVTARCLRVLADAQRATGDPDSARASLRRALPIHERVLGDEHPETRLCRDRLDALTSPH